MDAHLCLGGVYESLKQFDRAVSAFEAVLQMDPENTKALEAYEKLKPMKGKVH